MNRKINTYMKNCESLYFIVLKLSYQQRPPEEYKCPVVFGGFLAILVELIFPFPSTTSCRLLITRVYYEDAHLLTLRFTGAKSLKAETFRTRDVETTGEGGPDASATLPASWSGTSASVAARASANARMWLEILSQ